MTPAVWLVAFGILLVLLGVVATPFYHPLGNAAFWLGIALLVLGLILIIIPALG